MAQTSGSVREDGIRRSKKVLAWFVIVGCLGTQTIETLLPHDGRLWPFLDYPMYARAIKPGTTARMYELRAVACDASRTTRRITPYQIGHKEFRLVERLRTIADDRPQAIVHRAALSHVVAGYVIPRPCALQVWERIVTTTASGVDRGVLLNPHWTLRRDWPLEQR